MYLFILESIGTSELLLVGIVALIFLGPRKLPEYARKIGKITSEFRGTANEFKQTWEREANFQEEIKSLDLNELEKESAAEPVARTGDANIMHSAELTPAPAISEVDPERLEALRKAASEKNEADVSKPAVIENDKKNWL